MRAAYYDEIGPAAEVIRIGGVETPTPGSGEVLVRLAASGVNPHDVKRRSGWLGVDTDCPRLFQLRIQDMQAGLNWFFHLEPG